MNQNKPTWTVLFLGYPTPIIGLKLNSSNVNTIIRQHFDFIEENFYWTKYYFYIKGLKYPLSHRDFEVSLFLSKLSELLGSHQAFVYLRGKYGTESK